MDRQSNKPNEFSDVVTEERHRLITDFTRELDTLTRKHGVAIVGAKIEPLDLDWNGPDAEKWEQYAINEDDFLVRGFWIHHAKAVVR